MSMIQWLRGEKKPKIYDDKIVKNKKKKYKSIGPRNLIGII